LTSVTDDVSKILEPNKQLIKATENLISTISEIDFPSRLDKQDKEIKTLKTILFIICGLIVIGTVLILILCHK
jgi:hypothetical protein